MVHILSLALKRVVGKWNCCIHSCHFENVRCELQNIEFPKELETTGTWLKSHELSAL